MSKSPRDKHGQNGQIRSAQKIWQWINRDVPSLDCLLKDEFFNFADGRKYYAEHYNGETDDQTERMNDLTDDQQENDEAAR